MRNKTYSLSRKIKSDAKTLFNIVSNFDNYSHWNTLIPMAQGELKKGAQLHLMIQTNGKTKPFNPTVKSIIWNRSFLLSKVFITEGIGELTHEFEFRELANNQTEIVQTWEGKGVMVEMMWSKIEEGFSDFEIFNSDLAKYVER